MDMDEHREVSFKEAEQLAYVSLNESSWIVYVQGALCHSRFKKKEKKRKKTPKPLQLLMLLWYPVQENNVIFFEVSAYTAKNVTESLTHLAR